MIPSDLATIMRYVGKRYAFTPDNYPGLRGIPPEQRKVFAVNHSIHHLYKSLGKIAAECEASGHSGVLDEKALRRAVAKTFVDALRLAEELGMTAAELAEEVSMHTKDK